MPSFFSLVLAFGLLGPQGTESREDPEPILVGAAASTRLDPQTGVLAIRDAEGTELVRIDPSIGLRPAHPPRAWGPAKGVAGVDVEFLTREATESEPAHIDAALLRLGSGADDELRVSIGVYPGPYGPLLHYAIPKAAFAGLGEQASGAAGVTIDRTPLGLPASVGGARPERVASAFAPARIVLRTSLLGPLPAAEFRLRGRFAVDDASDEGAAARLRVLAGGAEMLDGRPLRPGEPAAEFDAPLQDAREITIEIVDADDARGRAIVDLVDVAFEGPGGLRYSLDELLARDEPGIDFFVGSELERLTRMPPEPDPRRDGLAIVDAKRPRERSVEAEPLLLTFQTAGGALIGIGLSQLPDATRFAFERGCVTLNAATPEPPGDGESLDSQIVVSFVVVYGSSRAELFRRYRESLVTIGGSAAIRAIGTITEPEWWRHPLLYVRRPAGHGRFATFDTFEAEKQIEETKRRLGLGRFTVVLDGPWNRVAGDPRPSDDFAGIRGLIAAQHVEGRHVLLRWDLFAAAPGSFAVTVHTSKGERIDPSHPRLYPPFVHEVVRRTLLDELHSLGADGFTLVGLDDVTDPLDGASVAEPSRGVGWRQLRLAIEPFRREVERMELDSLLMAPCAMPQLVTDIDAIRFEPAGAGPDVERERIAQTISVVPDLPLFFAPNEGSPREMLESAVRGVVVGVPAVSGRVLSRLSDEEAKALGAVLSLALETKIGIPAVDDGQRFRMEFEGRTYAETLPDNAGVVVYPNRRTAKVAVIDVTDVRLPFVPAEVLEGGDAPVEITGDGAILRGARPGVIYGFRVE